MLKTAAKCQFCDRPLDAQGFCTQYKEKGVVRAAPAPKQTQTEAR